MSLCLRNCSAYILDHADVLRELYHQVSATIDAQSVARNIFQNNALTLKELQSIQSKHRQPVRAAERLLDMVIKQSGNAFSCFVDSLKTTGHQHEFEMIVSGSYRGTHDNMLPVVLFKFYCAVFELLSSYKICHF